MIHSELGDCSGLCQELAVSKVKPEKERKGGAQELAKAAARLVCAMPGLCPTETVHTMELGYMLTWHSESGTGIEISNGGNRDGWSLSPSGP